jgi:hypothetical protein
MIRGDALKELNLEEKAQGAEIEETYLRLVRRYPPEFNPERFQKIDEAYRFLTSLPDMIEQLLSPSAGSGLVPADFNFYATLPPETVAKAIAELSRGEAMAALWPSGKTAAKK